MTDEHAGHGASSVVLGDVSMSVYQGSRRCDSFSHILHGDVMIGFVKLDDNNPHLALCHQRENA